MMSSIENIVKRLRDASHAYYETGSPIMTDYEYDQLFEQLKAICPNHEYCKQVGSIPSKDVVQLPIPMPSLRKIKPDSWSSWAYKNYNNGFVVSEKLDGISALWIPSQGALYLRGNGLKGQNISHYVPLGIQGLHDINGLNVMIRGELIVSKSVVANARNWVNGVIHQANPNSADVAKIQFIAYQVYGGGKAIEGLTRKGQMLWLQRNYFQVPWWSYVEKLDSGILEQVFQTRRQNSVYENDGIVVGLEKNPDVLDTMAADPKDIIAFKVACDDQRSETTVVGVEWAASLGGKWIPRVCFTPVTIGNAKIACCTGHNAKYIEANGIGPGARVIIRRSGDVIPYLETVVKRAEGGAQMPEQGTWTYDANGVHALDTSNVETPEKIGKQMLHSLTVFGYKGLGEKNIGKLVEGGVKSLFDILRMRVDELQGIIGIANGEKLYNGLRTCLQQASPEQWVLAWHGWPNGFGVATCRKLFQIEADVRKWKVEMHPGMLGGLQEYYEWKSSVLNGMGVNGMGVNGMGALLHEVGTVNRPSTIVINNTNTPATTGGTAVKGGIVFTGFRDATLEKQLTESGWEIQDGIKKTTKVLLVKDLTSKSGKVAAAEKAGIRILSRADANSLFSVNM